MYAFNLMKLFLDLGPTFDTSYLLVLFTYLILDRYLPYGAYIFRTNNTTQPNIVNMLVVISGTRQCILL